MTSSTDATVQAAAAATTLDAATSEQPKPGVGFGTTKTTTSSTTRGKNAMVLVALATLLVTLAVSIPVTWYLTKAAWAPQGSPSAYSSSSSGGNDLVPSLPTGTSSLPEVFMDPHNHLACTYAWEAIPLSYLWAIQDTTLLELMANVDYTACMLQPSDYGRNQVEDLCVYSFLRELRNTGRINGYGEHQELVILQISAYLQQTAQEMLKYAVSQSAFNGTAAGANTYFEVYRAYWGSRTGPALAMCAAKEEDPARLSLLLESTLLSSPNMDFDTALVMRDILEKVVAQRLESVDAETRTVQDETKWLLTLVEFLANLEPFDGQPPLVMLSSSVCKIPMKNCTEVLEPIHYGKGASNWCLESCNDLSNMYSLVIDSESRVPAAKQLQIQFLPMLLAPQLGSNSTGYFERAGPNHLRPSETLANFSGWWEVAEALLSQDHVGGIDFASPENYVSRLFDVDGELSFAGKMLEMQLDAVFESAVAHEKTSMFHVHSGEGFAAFDYTSAGFDNGPWRDEEAVETRCDFSTENLCSWVTAPFFGMSSERWSDLCEDAAKPYSQQKGLPIYWQATPDGDQEPVHYSIARRNVNDLAKFVARYREGLKQTGEIENFDRHVVVQVGHATHADAETARLMAENNMWADFQFSSNLATGSLRSKDTPDGQSAYKEYAVQLSYLSALHDESSELLDEIEFIEELFDAHSVRDMHAAGVCVTLGTDGTGLESSHNDQELYILTTILAETGDFEWINKAQRNLRTFLTSPPTENALTC